MRHGQSEHHISDLTGGWTDDCLTELGRLQAARVASRLEREIKRCEGDEMVVRLGDRVRLSKSGMSEAIRLTRQHRLWELYLITYAEVAPSHVDSGADAIEHVLEREVMVELESLLEETYPQIPQSPHALAPSGGS